MSHIVTETVESVKTSPQGSRKQASVVGQWVIGDNFKTKEVKLVNVTFITSNDNNQSTTRSSLANPLALPLTQSPVAISRASGRVASDAQQERTAVGRDTQPDAATNSVTSHDVDWTTKDIRLPLNVLVPRRHWSVFNPVGQRLSENKGIADLSPIDYFHWMFPMAYLQVMAFLTNEHLCRRNMPVTNELGILRFLGLLVLISRHELGPLGKLWATKSTSKRISTPNFSRIMSCTLFELLRCCIRFSKSDTVGDIEDMN